MKKTKIITYIANIGYLLVENSVIPLHSDLKLTILWSLVGVIFVGELWHLKHSLKEQNSNTLRSKFFLYALTSILLIIQFSNQIAEEILPKSIFEKHKVISLSCNILGMIAESFISHETYKLFDEKKKLENKNKIVVNTNELINQYKKKYPEENSNSLEKFITNEITKGRPSWITMQNHNTRLEQVIVKSDDNQKPVDL